MSESGVAKESVQPGSNEPVPPSDESLSVEKLTEVSVSGNRWENLSEKDQAETAVHNEVCTC